jgi:hypothetical protein
MAIGIALSHSIMATRSARLDVEARLLAKPG